MDIHKLIGVFVVFVGLVLIYKFNNGVIMTPPSLSGTAFVLIGMHMLISKK